MTAFLLGLICGALGLALLQVLVAWWATRDARPAAGALWPRPTYPLEPPPSRTRPTLVPLQAVQPQPRGRQ